MKKLRLLGWSDQGKESWGVEERLWDLNPGLFTPGLVLCSTMLLPGPFFFNPPLSFWFFFLFILRLASQQHLLTSCNGWLGKRMKDTGNVREGGSHTSCPSLEESSKTLGPTCQGHILDNLLPWILWLHNAQVSRLIIPPQLSPSFCIYYISSDRSLSHCPASFPLGPFGVRHFLTSTLMLPSLGLCLPVCWYPNLSHLLGPSPAPEHFRLLSFLRAFCLLDGKWSLELASFAVLHDFLQTLASRGLLCLFCCSPRSCPCPFPVLFQVMQ